ncbi:MAG: PIN domain-containing protein [Phototrophicales bacterium]|nr:PIN domain-containing protein [Phototrophicales bacterium]
MSRYYIFDTNIVSALLQMSNLGLLKQIQSHKRETLILCDPVIYEIERGLKHRQAHNMLARFHLDFVPLFELMPVRLEDWKLAGLLWSNARSQGKQLSDVDLLIGAISIRLDGIIVSDDQDFGYIPVKLQNWLRP